MNTALIFIDIYRLVNNTVPTTDQLFTSYVKVYFQFSLILFTNVEIQISFFYFRIILFYMYHTKVDIPELYSFINFL